MGLFGTSRTPAQQRVWDRVYETSINAYTSIRGYDDFDARKTATVAVNGLFTGSGARRNPAGLSDMPDPGNVLNLGTFLELHFVDGQGKILMDSFAPSDHVALLWSEGRKACYIVPSLAASACNRLPTPREDKLARRWAKGRPAACGRVVNFPAPAMPVVHPGIAITYDSDKFNHGTNERFIHHFGPGVRCYFARTFHGSPHAIMVRGGKLRLTSHGLAG
jgi:hypothetical protein